MPKRRKPDPLPVTPTTAVAPTVKIPLWRALVRDGLIGAAPGSRLDARRQSREKLG